MLEVSRAARTPFRSHTVNEAAALEESFKAITQYVALGIEAAAAIGIAIGAAETIVRLFLSRGSWGAALRATKEVWLRFATWLLLGLEFELAADILRTAISRSWTDIGQLAAIAAIRTFLNSFLERDIEKAAARAATGV